MDYSGSSTPIYMKSNLENRFAAVETTADVNQNHEYVVRILREEGSRFCNMQRKGKKSKLSEETLGLMKKRRENPPVTSSAKRALNQEINKHHLWTMRRPLTRLKSTLFWSPCSVAILPNRLAIHPSDEMSLYY
ncbi:hypothetical protein B5X24_HaOG216735 [Helicoverpa armigera]|nr:hypothetical protein B5X24_HaOG216735 [Helicoverpa armigera]